MAKDKAFVQPVSPEAYEGIAKLGRKLDFKPMIDYISDDGSVRIRHEGSSYTIDPNGRCTVYTSENRSFDID